MNTTFQTKAIIFTYLTMVTALEAKSTSLRGSSTSNRNLWWDDNHNSDSTGNIVHDTLNFVGDLFHKPTNEPIETQVPTQAPTNSPTQVPTQDSRDNVPSCSQVYRPVECINSANGLLETFGNSCYARNAGYSSNECVEVQQSRHHRNLWHHEQDGSSGNIVHDTLNWVGDLFHKPTNAPVVTQAPTQGPTDAPTTPSTEEVTLPPTNMPSTAAPSSSPTYYATLTLPPMQCDETNEIMDMMSSAFHGECSWVNSHEYECGTYYEQLGFSSSYWLVLNSDNLPSTFYMTRDDAIEQAIYFDNDCNDASKVRDATTLSSSF